MTNIFQSLNIPGVCFIYGYWMAFNFHGEFNGNLINAGISSLTFLIVIMFNIYLWILVVAYYREKPEAGQMSEQTS